MNGRPERTALVTGAARGLGRAMAVGLARAGYAVAACDIDGDDVGLARTARDLTAAGRAFLPLVCDVTDPDSCRETVETARERFGAVDILVNNAAIGMERLTPHIHANPYKFYEVEESFWQRVLDVNLMGMFRMTRLAAPGMVANGWGRIVNVTTSLTTMQKAGFAPYGPSKAAIEAATGSWSKELAGTGVTANVLIPGGPADTRMIPLEDMPERTALVAPEKMVAPLLWLASDAASATTGRRFQAKLWPEDKPADEAAGLAGASIAWA